MTIISLNIAVDSATCDGCGAKADRQIITATRYGFGGNGGPPDGADMLAQDTTLPLGWVTESRKGAEDSSRVLCATCAGTAKTAVETAMPSLKAVVVEPEEIVKPG
jgi:hypothetical protein